MINLVNEYFSAFESKNLKKLEELFSDTIKLIDWDLHMIGKDQVLKANKNIFNSVTTIKIVIERLIKNQNTVAAEIKILIDDSIWLNVLDIIDFNDQRKIEKITAFKR